jgi:polar amino acid transport system substrate-binding protein
MKGSTPARQTLLAILAIIAAIFLSACTRAQTTMKTSVYERVLQTGTLRVAYISYPPSFIKDAKTGKLSGIMYDTLEELARRLEIKTDYVEETTWATMIEEIRSQRVDMVCTGLWPNAARGKLVDFTDAVYFSPIKAYAKAGNHAFDGNLSAINSGTVKIAAIDGEMSSIIARTDFPKGDAQALPQTTDIAQLLLEIADDKSHVTFVEPAVANEFTLHNPGKIEEIKNIPPLRVFPNVFMVAKGEQSLLSMLNIALGEIANTGVIDRIVTKYEKSPGLFLRRQLPYHPETR